ncbi:MAG: ribosome maturation factor RimM [Austwickia sp.]|nr:ribosome maturation factor RimM [Austwickia sp.]MCO5309668.1 ribosome maturation factor RimM [Austwickia sp.]
MDTVVARIGRAHGLRGEVTVQLHTDNPQERLVSGATYAVAGLPHRPGPAEGPGQPRQPGQPGQTDQPAPSELTIETVRVHNGTWLLAFAGYADRSAAESLRGGRLLMASPQDETDGWYESELVGLAVFDPSGARVGTVTGLQIGAAQDRLEVALTDGRTGLVPFVEALVPVLDVAGGRVVIDAPDGLFDLDSRG